MGYQASVAERTPIRTLRESLALARLMLRPRRDDAPGLYRVLGRHNTLAEASGFLNMGLWATATTYDEACADLARRLGAAAGLNPGDAVLDCGCGHGDQDALFAAEFRPFRVVGLNASAEQVAEARRRVDHPAVRFQVGDATALPFADGSFDVVLALEAAFHFDTRADFLREAHRVLAPGGRLALADPALAVAPAGPAGWAATWAANGVWQVPLANVVAADAYGDEVEAAGFTDVRVEDLTAQVVAPFKAFAVRRTRDPDVRARLHPLLRWTWGTDLGQLDHLRYLLVAARRP